MRATKTTVISIIAIGLLAGSSVAVAAQEEEAAAEPSTPAKVTGTINTETGDLVEEPTETVVDGMLEVRDGAFTGERFEMDDARLSGTGTVAFNVDVHPVNDFEDVVLEVVDFRIDNDDGSWAGRGTMFVHNGAEIPEEEAINLMTLPLTGSGAYEGLSAYLIIDGSEDQPIVEGVIYAGEMPPFPELPAE